MRLIATIPAAVLAVLLSGNDAHAFGSAEPYVGTSEAAGGTLETLDPTTVFDFPEMKKLHNGKNRVEICGDHFPSGSPERAEIDAAVANYHGLPGTSLELTIAEVPHKSGAEIFPENPDKDLISIDYIDVEHDEDARVCHSSIGEGGWMANRCEHVEIGGWNPGFSLGRADSVVINLNGWRKTYRCHFLQLNRQECAALGMTINYAKEPLYTHELGHAFGIPHVPEWPEAQQIFLSVASSGHNSVTPRDLEFLQRKYPGKNAETADYAMATRLRHNDKSSDFDEFNGKSLYSDENGKLLDCATEMAPEVKVTWFNLAGIETSHSFDVKLTFKTTHSDTVTLKSIPVSGMDKNAETSWIGSLDLTQAEFGPTSSEDFLRGTFTATVDAGYRVSERDEGNNSATAAMTIFSTQAGCPQ